MRLIVYEMKKLCGIGYLWVTLAVMTAALVGLLVYRSGALSYDLEADRAARELYAGYDNDFTEFEEAREAYFEYAGKRQDIINYVNQSMAGASKEELEVAYEEALSDLHYTDRLGCVRRNGDIIPDSLIFAYWPSQSTDEFKKFSVGTVNMTAMRMERYMSWIREGTPAYEYLRHMNEAYSNVVDKVEPGALTPGAGWMLYFRFEEAGLFMLVYLILFSGAVFQNENICGTTGILRTSKRGRSSTILAKLAALLIADVFIVSVFTLASYALFALTCGCTGGDMPIQALYYYAPYTISIAEAAFIQYLLRIASAVAFSVLTALASSLTPSLAVSYIVGAAQLLVNMTVNYYVTYSGWCDLNLFNMMSTRLIVRFDEICVLGHYYPKFIVGVIVCTLVSVVGAALIVVFSNAGRSFARRSFRSLWMNRENAADVS